MECGRTAGRHGRLAPLGIDVVIVEPGPFETSFFDNLKQGSRRQVVSAYGHVGEFFGGFESTVRELFENGDAPTDAHVVVEIFERLIDTPRGQRPLRTIAGLDFGLQALNDATDPIRRATLESMGITDWDAPKG